MTNTQFPFCSAVAAIVHAFNDERHGASCRPAMSRLADKRLSEPGEFSGMDRGAEKATAEHMLTRGLSRTHLAALRARYAPRTRMCPCCNQTVSREDWLAALRELAVGVAPIVDMPSVSGDLRMALVRRYYEGNKGQLDALASDHGASLASVSRANSLLSPWLRGRKKAKGDKAVVEGIDQAAFREAAHILRAGGFIE